MFNEAKAVRLSKLALFVAYTRTAVAEQYLHKVIRRTGWGWLAALLLVGSQ